MNARVAALAIAAIAMAAWWFGSRPPEPPTAASPATSAATPAILYWYDPMRPDVHFEQPGKSPFMDMELVPKYAARESETADSAIRVEPAMVASLGIRTAAVRSGTVQPEIVATGRVTTDERSLRRVTARVAGWVETLHVRAEGERVTRGQPLAVIYSPALGAAQGELALALASGQPGLADGARARLRALGVPRAQISAAQRARDTSGRVALAVPADGYLMRLTVREGDAVAPEVAIAEFASHDPVWIIADVPEALTADVAVGQAATIRVPAHPDHTVEATIDHLYPELDPATRTQRVRLVVANADERLHPGMYAEVRLSGTPRENQLLVPTEALIRTGRHTLVIVADAAGRFRPVTVTPGLESGDDTVVLAGLDAGAQVVVSGQFLLDSEASLRGAYRRMGAADAHRHPAPVAAPAP